jgi:hypothetical protein
MAVDRIQYVQKKERYKCKVYIQLKIQTSDMNHTFYMEHVVCISF